MLVLACVSVMWDMARGCASEYVLYSPVGLACPFFNSLWVIFWWLSWSDRADILGACVLFWAGRWAEEEEWMIAFFGLPPRSFFFSFLLASGLSFGFFQGDWPL